MEVTEGSVRNDMVKSDLVVGQTGAASWRLGPPIRIHSSIIVLTGRLPETAAPADPLRPPSMCPKTRSLLAGLAGELLRMTLRAGWTRHV